jgi:hypothetical protein
MHSERDSSKRALVPRVGVLPCVAALACSGCASINVVATTGDVFHAWGSVPEEDEPAEKAAKASAVHDIPCAGGVVVAAMPEREHLQHGGREVVAEGCGERVTYLESCEGFADGFGKVTCKYVMTGRLSTRPAQAPAGGHP